MVHDLKISPNWFDLVASGEKTFEIRFNDRGFLIGDQLCLNEYLQLTGYTGRSCNVYVTHVWRDLPGLLPGYIVLAITRATPQEPKED